MSLAQIWYDVLEKMLPMLGDSSGRPRVIVDTLPVLPAGNNNIGDVDIASIAAGANLIGRVDARNGNKITSYSATYAEAGVNLNTPAAGVNLSLGAVPATTIRHVTHIAAWNANTSPASIEIFINYSAIASMPLARVLLPGAGGELHWEGHQILRAGDNPFAAFGAGALNDDTFIRASGWDETL